MLHRLLLCFAALSVGAVARAEYRAASDTDRPNILWITVEDMSPRIACYGDRTVETPALDRLARQSLRYTRCFGTYGVCAPNRHTLIMGMYPSSTGAMAMRTWQRTSALDQITDPELLAIPTYEATPPPEAKCFTEYLRADGYYCTNSSKTDYQFQPPITAWDESGTEAHWRNRPSDETPFFAVFNSTATHESKVFARTSPRVAEPEKVELPPYYPDTPLVRRDLARHYDNIAKMDAWVGDLLAQLEDDGLAENTLVFFFSDHGDGLPRAKRWVYDSGLHVPLLVRFPDGSRAGETTGELVSFVDFAPTALSVAGVDVPPHMQGQAFLGPERGEPRKYVYACRDRMDPAPETIRAVRDERFKYVRNYRPELPYIGWIPYRDQQEIMQDILRLKEAEELGPDQWQFWAEKKPLEELYDTEADPHEIRNLASDPRHFEKLAELRDAHERWTRETGDLGHLAETELINRLWPGGEQPTTDRPVIQTADADGGRLLVTLRCASDGASIAYRTGNARRWQLYTAPFPVDAGTKVIARANRLGWKPSETASVRVGQPAETEAAANSSDSETP